jgi:hypothetical protein
MKLTEPGKQWLQVAIDMSIGDVQARRDKLQRQLQRFPSGYVRNALLPQIEAHEALIVLLSDLARASLLPEDES